MSYQRDQPRSSHVLIATLLLFVVADSARADHPRTTDEELHFSDPIFSESPSPDTKIRIDYSLRKETKEERALLHRARIEAEYSPIRWLSFEFDLPYTVADRDEEPNRHNVDDLEAAIKLASFLLEERGILFGGGLEFELPTGNSDNEIGTDRLVEIEPFVDVGVKYGSLEVIGFVAFGLPVNSNAEDSDWELSWNASLLYPLIPRVEAILEFDGERVWGGEEDGETVAHVSPGLKVMPFEDHALAIGSGISLPITNDEEFDLRWTFSVFYHF